jgi:tyrosine-protein phosphatase YwqE
MQQSCFFRFPFHRAEEGVRGQIVLESYAPVILHLERYNRAMRERDERLLREEIDSVDWHDGMFPRTTVL